jgi:hypothetical protein
VSGLKRFGVAIVSIAAILSLAACGFVGARKNDHIKPSGFLLYGHAAVTLPSDDHRAIGSACVAPGSASDVARDTRVTVLDPDGKKIAIGALDNGVIARSANGTTCDFSFSIPAVPGGVDTYSVQIGSRAPQQFAATSLRQNTPAIITITP